MRGPVARKTRIPLEGITEQLDTRRLKKIGSRAFIKTHNMPGYGVLAQERTLRRTRKFRCSKEEYNFNGVGKHGWDIAAVIGCLDGQPALLRKIGGATNCDRHFICQPERESDFVALLI